MYVFASQGRGVVALLKDLGKLGVMDVLEIRTTNFGDFGET